MPVGFFALLCFGQGIEMRIRPTRSLRSSRECTSMRLEPDTVWTIVGVEAQPDYRAGPGRYEAAKLEGRQIGRQSQRLTWIGSATGNRDLKTSKNTAQLVKYSLKPKLFGTCVRGCGFRNGVPRTFAESRRGESDQDSGGWTLQRLRPFRWPTAVLASSTGQFPRVLRTQRN